MTWKYIVSQVSVVIFTIEMTTVFKTTIKPILIMGKLFGIINVSYVLEPAGLLVRNTNSTYYYSFLEILRMSVLLMCTFVICTARLTILFYILLIKWWVVVIIAKLFETSMIKLINGIIEFDKKIALLPKFLLDRQRTPSKTYWKKIIIILSLYFIAFDLIQIYLWPPHSIQITIILEYLFAPPYAIDFVVIISSCFYLYNIDIRFEMLNDFWGCVPVGLVAVPEQFTHCEIAILIETIRLLHAELSELLKTFSMGYGPLVLGFFVFSYINMSIQFFFMVCIDLTAPGSNVGDNIARNTIIHVLNVQVLLFLTSTILTVSRIHEKRRKLISYLRLNRISYLPLDIKRQIKLFMNQISVFDYDEVTAFGFFNINLNLVVSILVLLVTGLSTLVQMKDHPIILGLANDTINVMKTSFDNIS